MPASRILRRDRARRVAAPRRAPAAEALEARELLSRDQFDIAGARDTVFDAGRNLLYVTTGHGAVERIDLSTMTRLAPWAVGTSLNGADITPDGSALFVTEDGRYADDPATEAPDAILHKVNLATGAVTDFTYALGFQEIGGLDAQVAANGKVYVTSGRTGSSALSGLVEIDVATGGSGRPAVDLADYTRTRARIGRTDAATLATFDFDHDRDVDAADLMTARANQRRALPVPTAPAPAVVTTGATPPPTRPPVTAARRTVLGEVPPVLPG